MKKRLVIILAILTLLTAFAGCGGIKEEELIGTWRATFLELTDGTREEFGSVKLVFKKDGAGEFSAGSDSYFIDFTWKISGSKVTLYYKDGEEGDTYTYKDGELVTENPNGTKTIMIKR